jgi:hypothetical protein
MKRVDRQAGVGLLDTAAAHASHQVLTIGVEMCSLFAQITDIIVTKQIACS